MDQNPLYESPKEDQGRDDRTEDWDKSEIMDFVRNHYDHPLERFEADDYEDLEDMIGELGLPYDEDSDWRHEQVPDLGDKDYGWGTIGGLALKEEINDDTNDPDDYVPWGVLFEDEEGEVQVEFDKK